MTWPPLTHQDVKDQIDLKVPAVVVYGTGIDATGVSDSTAAIQALITALPAVGGWLHFPAGKYRIDGGLTSTVPVTITGAGAGWETGTTYNEVHAAPTQLLVNSTTVTALTLNVGSTVRDLSILNDSGTTPTAGNGIRMIDGRRSRLDRVDVIGFYDCIRCERGDYSEWSKLGVFDPVRYGIYLTNTTEPDAGDMVISDSVITARYKGRNATSGVRWESGGGPKFLGVKINGQGPSAGFFTNGFDFRPADGVTTSVVLVEGCSIENVSVGILVAPLSTTGNVGKIVITGCEILLLGSGNCISVTGVSSSTQYVGVVINNNTLQCVGGGAGVTLKYTSGVVGRNFVLGAQYGLYLDTGCSVAYDLPQISGTGFYVYDLNTTLTGTVDYQGPVDYMIRRELPDLTTVANMLRVEAPAYNAVVIRVTVAGTAQGVGGFLHQQTRSVYNASNLAATVTTVGTDLAVGVATAQVQVAYSTGQNMAVIIQIGKAGGATASVISGTVTVEVLGSAQGLYRY